MQIKGKKGRLLQIPVGGTPGSTQERLLLPPGGGW